MSMNEPRSAGDDGRPQPDEPSFGGDELSAEDPAPNEDPAPVDGGSAAAPNDQPADHGESTRAAKKRTSRNGFVQWLKELPLMLAIAFIIAILLRSFVVQAFWIPSGSMEQTLHGCPGCTGDRILVNRMSYWFSEPEPGDIVVFQAPSTWEAEVPVDEPDGILGQSWLWVKRLVGAAPPAERDLVKRVIATEGQTIECCDAQGRVLVDGQPLDEPYIFLDGQDPAQYGATAAFGPVTVPEGRMFVMGDHRNASADSRAHLNDQHQGTVPVDSVIGRAFVVLWPFDRFNWLSRDNPQQVDAAASVQSPLALPAGALLDPPVLALLLAAPISMARAIGRKGC